jgi:hypothetical protein
MASGFGYHFGHFANFNWTFWGSTIGDVASFGATDRLGRRCCTPVCMGQHNGRVASFGATESFGGAAEVAAFAMTERTRHQPF